MSDINRPLRVGIWCAVSSRAQAAEDKVSLPEQERAGREFADSIGGQVVGVYTVPGHSRNLWRWDEAEALMPAYRQLREDAEAGRLDVLHIYEMSRLGRDPALAQAAVSMLEHNGAEVYNAASPHQIGQRSIGSRYAEAIEMVSANEEQRKRVRRLISGMRGRVYRGLPPPSLPTGYAPVRDGQGNVVGAELDEMAGAVEMATDLFLRGLSYQEICDALESSQYDPPRIEETGGQWRYSTIWKWTHNDSYAGYSQWGEIRPDEPSTRYPALWDTETFQAILRERDRRASSCVRSRGTPFLDVAFCLRCGDRMTRCTAEHAVYLRCARHANSSIRSRRNYGQPCHANYVRENAVRLAIVDFLMRIVSLDDLNEATALPDAPDRTAQRLEQVEMLLEDYESQRRRLALALAAGKMQPDMYAETDANLLARIDTLRVEQAALKRKQMRRIAPARRFEAVEEARDALCQRLDAMPVREVNRLLKTAGVRVLCEEGDVIEVGFFASI